MRLVSRDANDVYEIGNKIREAREAQGMSQDDLADVMGTSRQLVSRHESGTQEMKISTYFQFLDALNATQLLPQRLCEKEGNSGRERLKELTEKMSDEDIKILITMAERMMKDSF